MRIAIPYDNGNVFQHFGHTECFKVYTTENDQISSTSLLKTNGSGHGALAGILKENTIDTLICGGIGSGAKNALAEAGIILYGGIKGDTDEAVTALLTGNLNYDPDVACSHHDEHHHGEAHDCGPHPTND